MWIGRNIDRLTVGAASVPVFSHLLELTNVGVAIGVSALGGYGIMRGGDALLKKMSKGNLSVRDYAKKIRQLDSFEDVFRNVLIHRGVYPSKEDAVAQPQIIAEQDEGRVKVRCEVPIGSSSAQVEVLGENLAAALRAHSVRVTGREPGWVIFTVFPEDGLVNGTELSAAVLEQGQSSVVEPISLGVDELGESVSMRLYAQTVLVGGSPGSGKSALTWSLLGHAALDPRSVLCVIDLKPYGIETAPVADRANYTANTSDEAAQLLERVWLEVDRRNKILRDRMADKADPNDPDMPPIVIFCDEAAELTRDGTDEGKSALQYLTRIVAVGRASGIGVVLVTQKPDSSVLPTALRDLMAQRICLRVGNRAQAETILGPLPENVRPWEIGADQPGRGFAIDSSGQGRLFQGAFIDRESVLAMGQHAAQLRNVTELKPFELPEVVKVACTADDSADSESVEGQKPRRRRRKRS